MKKTYEEFKTYVAENIKEYLPAEYYDSIVTIQKTIKNNGAVMEGLSINNGEAVSPVLYLEGIYDSYKKGKELPEIMENMASTCQELMNHMPEFDLDSIRNFEEIRNQIRARLINQMQNVELLNTVPYQAFEDLAVTYHLMLSEDIYGTASIPITNQLMEMWGTDRDTIHETALGNMISADQMNITSLYEIMRNILQRQLMEQDGMEEVLAEQMTQKILEEAEETPLYIVTNDSGLFGAVEIMSEDIREQISDMMGGDYYVLPSSVHEVLVLSADSGMRPEELADMVQNINESFVDEKDRLSDHVYYYNAREKTLSLAEYRTVEKNPEEQPEVIQERDISIRR